MKLFYIIFFLLWPVNVFAMNVPDEPVDMYIDYGQISRFSVFFLQVNNQYSIANWVYYDAWCLNRYQLSEKNRIYTVHLYSDYTKLPVELMRVRWDQINYLINHKEGNAADIQNAIWFVIHGKGELDETSKTLVRNTYQNGTGFVPTEGDLIAIVCYAKGVQPIFIEYRIPIFPSVTNVKPVMRESVVIPPEIGFCLGADAINSYDIDSSELYHRKHITPIPSTISLFIAGLLVLLFVQLRSKN